MAPGEDRGRVSYLQPTGPPGVARRSCAGGRRLARDGCGTRRGDRWAAARRPRLLTSGPVPPQGGDEAGGDERFRWWGRLPSGLLLPVLLGALVFWALLSQGENLFSNYLAIP